MRNLKRVLALALALVMMLGMMITANAATYADQAAIDAKYADAVEVLTGMGIFKGNGAGFAPKAVLTRAEASALIYRVITGDVNDKQVDLYDYTSFADVQEGAWYTGYITYASNGGYIKGYAGNAMPNDTVTGIQVLAIMLRAIGYGQNGEYEGAAWKDYILTDAKELGITTGISTNDLDKGATRELVAQLIWNAVSGVDMVSYNMLMGYAKVNVGTIFAPEYQTLGEKVFGLTEVKNVYDNWGRPSTLWTDGKAYNLTTGDHIYAVIEDIPVATYTTAVTECDIAADLKLRTDGTVTKVTVNGKAAVVDNFMNGDNTITRLATWQTVGEQGRLTEIYKKGTPANPVYEIVMIDQFLAEVEDVIAVEYDRNNHIKNLATLVLTVYDEADTEVVLFSTTNWEYTKGDMLLVYAETIDTAANTVVDTTAANQHVEFLGAADSITGAQTQYSTAPVHVVGGVEYPDAIQFNEDQTIGDQIAEHTWYFDTYGNLIAAFDIRSKTNFGTITNIYWQDSFGGELGYALATITYMDGTSSVEKIYSIKEVGDTVPAVLKGVEGYTAADYATGLVSSTKQYNEVTKDANGENVYTTDYTNVALYEIATTPYGLALTEKTKLTDAQIETGVPAMTAGMNAGNTTQFLVWNEAKKTYETYTGINNVPSYKADGAIWVYDRLNDKVAEYVFVINNSRADETNVATYYYDKGLTVTNMLYNWQDGTEYYVVAGGYVNGKLDTIKIKAADKAILDIVTNAAIAKEQLMFLTVTNGYVTDIALNVNTTPVELSKPTKTWAVYEGAVTDGTKWVTLADGVLVTLDGSSYNVATTDVVTYQWGLEASVKYDANAKLYIVYTVGETGNKVAELIYITDVAAGNVNQSALTVVFETALLNKINTENAKDAYKLTLPADVLADTTVINSGSVWKSLKGWVAAVETTIETKLAAGDDAAAYVDGIIAGDMGAVVTMYLNTLKTEAGKIAAATATVKNASDLATALSNGSIKTIVLGANITGVTSTINLGSKNLDGAGYTIAAANTVDVVVATTGAKISNVTISGGTYGIKIDNSNMAADLELDNVTILNSTRAFNITGKAGETAAYKLIVKNSKLAGKISFSETEVKSATFTNCEFKVMGGTKGDMIEFYTGATFTGCDFATGFKFSFADLKALGYVVDIELVDCTANGVALADVTYTGTEADVTF